MGPSGAVARLAYLALPWSPAIGRSLATRQELLPTRPFRTNVRVSDEPPAIRKRCGVTEEILYRSPGHDKPWSSRVRCYVTVDLEQSGATMRTELLRLDRKSTRL